MSSTFPVYRHHHNGFTAILIIFLFIILAFLFIGVTEAAFGAIGITRGEFAIILIATFLGSFVNIPVRRMKNVQRVVEYDEVKVFLLTYRVPRSAVKEVSTLVAVNLGGAVIPVLVSGYLLVTHFNQIFLIIVATMFKSVIVHFVARRVQGVGIVTPTFVPPLAAALISLVLLPAAPTVIAYVSGTLGALIGADLTNMRNISKFGAPVVSIGGAGTFDGIFLTGIIAVVLVSLF